MNLEREGITYERFEPLRSWGDPYYVVRHHGSVVGVVHRTSLVRRYKTRPPKYYEGFKGVWPDGTSHCARSRRVLAGWMVDFPDGQLWP